MVSLFHGDCFGRALVDAGLAIDAEIDVDLRFAVFHLNGDSRADVYAGLTSGTLLNINNCWQLCSSECTYIMSVLKNKFRFPFHSPRTSCMV